jgi:hypothetical protein
MRKIAPNYTSPYLMRNLLRDWLWAPLLYYEGIFLKLKGKVVEDLLKRVEPTM